MVHPAPAVASQRGAAGWPALFWTAFKRSRNAMVLLDDRRRHVEVNGGYLALLGYRRDELIGEPVYRVVAGGPLTTRRQWQAAIRKGQFTGAVALVCSDGHTVMVQYAAHPEHVTGRDFVLCVALQTARGGRRLRPGPDEPDPHEALSEREREIVRMIALGSSGPEIAEELHISHNTVRTHVSHAMAKLGVRSRAQLVATALGDGLVLR